MTLQAPVPADFEDFVLEARNLSIGFEDLITDQRTRSQGKQIFDELAKHIEQQYRTWYKAYYNCEHPPDGIVARPPPTRRYRSPPACKMTLDRKLLKKAITICQPKTEGTWYWDGILPNGLAVRPDLDRSSSKSCPWSSQASEFPNKRRAQLLL